MVRAGLEKGLAYAEQLDAAAVLPDLNAAINAVTHDGRVGMVGFGSGGRATYLAGCRTNIAAGVAYYGNGITDVLGDTPRCPMLFHFGETDRYISAADVEAIRKAYPKGTYYLYPTGHGFNCPNRNDFDAACAHLAFERSVEFFGNHVG